jgi:hypothetical protein
MSEHCVDNAYYWTPHEAAAILEYLDRLRDCVWELYQEDIIQLREQDRITLQASSEYQQQLDLEDSPPAPACKHSYADGEDPF